MSYFCQAGQWQPGVYGLPGRPDMPSGVPGPGSPGVPSGATPATQPFGLFPTNAKWGDVINVTGDFTGLHQGQALVRFAGVPAQAISIMGPFGGSVVVPEGAESGSCRIEVDGRQVFGAHCVISKGISGPRAPARAPEHAAVRAWKNFGTGTPLLGLGQLQGPIKRVMPGGIKAAAPQPSFLERHKTTLTVGAVAVAVIGGGIYLLRRRT